MKLAEWISAQGGRCAVARQLGISRDTIHYWLAKKTSPRLKTMRKIEKLSGGRVTVEAILHETGAFKRLRGER